MKNWSFLLIIAVAILLVPVFSANVSAQEEASLSISKLADVPSASVNETITYTYTITNTGTAAVDNVTLEDDKLGIISLDTTSIAPGDNVTTTATYVVVVSDLPGPIINTASVTGIDPSGKSVSATSNSVSVSLNKSLMTKFEILKQSGVPGKGIDTAPGLQKLFNPKSQAAEHAGKKDKPVKNELKIKSRVKNQSVSQQLRIRAEIENQP